MAEIKVRTNGQTLTVKASVSHWTTAALAVTASGTNDVESTTTTTITSDYSMHFANTATTATITVKQLDGTTLVSQTFEVNPGVGLRVLNPLPDPYQAAADSRAGRSLATAAALAETIPRGSGATFGNVASLSSARLYLVAIDLPQGLTVTSITFWSATTACSGPENQWFALYDSARVLLGQTTDDTTTAWAANAAKTLSLVTPYVTTYAGLHYLGCMVKASSAVPTLHAAAPSLYINGQVPILHGVSTQTLTTTAPDPAAAITAGSSYAYAYVS